MRIDTILSGNIICNEYLKLLRDHSAIIGLKYVVYFCVLNLINCTINYLYIVCFKSMIENSADTQCAYCSPE